MQYMMILTYEPEAETAGEEHTASMQDWVAYTKALEAAGVLRGGQALGDAETATTVRVRGGRRVLTDGPFTESKEHVIGYYLVEVGDLDEALSWAERVPNVTTGSVEVRPLASGTSTSETLAHEE